MVFPGVATVRSLVLLLPLRALLRADVGQQCAESPFNWTAVREDLITYATLSEPKHRSRRCFGLDPGIWSYCGISAMRMLQLQPGLFNSPHTSSSNGGLEEASGTWDVLPELRNPCKLGSVTLTFFSMIFLTRQERHGMLFHAGDSFDKLGFSFNELLNSHWPLFGVLARLAEEVQLSGAVRKVDKCTTVGVATRSPTADGSGQQVFELLQAEVVRRVVQQQWVTTRLARQVLAALELAAPAAFRGEVGAVLPSPGCSFALATAWSALAESAALAGQTSVAADLVHRAEATLRQYQSNYTHLDWLSSQWPIFRILHRLQFGLLAPAASPVQVTSTARLAEPEERERDEETSVARGPMSDLVPRDTHTGQPLRFAFNRGFARSDVLHIDIAADIVLTDLLRSMPAFFGITPALPDQTWHLGFVYTSGDYDDLIPSRSLWRLKAASQRLLFVPRIQEVIGEKDSQCKVYQEGLRQWAVTTSFSEEIGGMPECFELPQDRQKLHRLVAQESASQSETQHQREAYVYKPEGAWGGRGIEIRFGLKDLLAPEAGDDSRADTTSCAFNPLRDVQCLGLEKVEAPEASDSEAACQAACCREAGETVSVGNLAALPSTGVEGSIGHGVCNTWNWRPEDGCWTGTARICSSPNPTFLGGWRGGHRMHRREDEPRAVLQRYVLDPVIYQLEGIRPPLRVKTDIRIYGAVVSLDPLRIYVSRHGYFRTGYLERNYSATADADFLDRLVHLTHHIPKIENGSYQCPTAPSWGDPAAVESDAASGGSLRKWFHIARDQNGLDVKRTWMNIRLALGLFVLSARQQLACHVNPVPHACGSVGFQFFADLVVDTRGRAWMMEMHPTLAVKSHGLGDPEGGWVEVLTRETRQGALGTLAMFFAGWMNAPYRVWVSSVIQQQLLSQHRWYMQVILAQRALSLQRAAKPGWGGEASSLAGLLSRMVVERHMSCRLSVATVLPGFWRHFHRHLDSYKAFGANLRPFYQLFELALQVIRRALPHGARSPPGDLRPAHCTAVDFNAGTIWDQPWERSSRRFPM